MCDPERLKLRFAWSIGVSFCLGCGRDKVYTLSCYARDLAGPVHQRGLCDEGWVSGLVRAEVSDVEDAIDCDEGWLVEPCSDIVLVQGVAVQAHGRCR